MAYKALKAACLPFKLICAEDIKKGVLGEYRLLFVPGGWASNKIKTLGTDGIIKIKAFVGNGGNYLGFCGGAGLATLDGIGLLNIRRKPTKERVPSFSGRIRLNLSEHSIWHGITEPVFHAWWPSQLVLEDKSIRILATYGDALPDSFSSDLNVGDIGTGGNWVEMEKTYKINLDPLRLNNEPAVVEGGYGKGKVLLSLVHFDTPGDANGTVVLKNIWHYLAPCFPVSVSQSRSPREVLRLFGAGLRVGVPASGSPKSPSTFWRRSPCRGSQTSRLFSEFESAVDDLIALGELNFIWFRRNDMLLQWRRGVRGLEYCTLNILIKEISQIIKNRGIDPSGIADCALRINELLVPFVEKAKHLLILERNALHNGHITYEKCDDPEIRKIRSELFSNSKSYGGLFKELIDEVDALLYSLL